MYLSQIRYLSIYLSNILEYYDFIIYLFPFRFWLLNRKIIFFRRVFLCDICTMVLSSQGVLNLDKHWNAYLNAQIRYTA